MYTEAELFSIAKDLLISLIEIPSISREENKTADFIEEFLNSKSIHVNRINNNIIARSQYFSESKPTILLNSHHDTVKPNELWETNPFKAVSDSGKIIGLGSNDAGGPLVSLISAFLYVNDLPDLPFNVIFVASAEEEVSGTNGIESILPHLPPISVAIVGEPTCMQMAVAEKGLLVLDCKAIGKSGHAAHTTGDNAIYKAMRDIEWFKNYEFPEKSEFLGPVKMTVTCINAGTQHNVIPAECNFTVDIRTNEFYTNERIYEIITNNIQSEVTARSFRLNSSRIDDQHPIVLQAKKMGIHTFGSPTLSDQAFMKHIPSVKIGPGDTLRSHTAQEYILESEIQQGIQLYIQLLTNLQL